MRYLSGILLFIGYVIITSPLASAAPAIGLQPLQYVETLQKSERKKAFIDVTNPSPEPVTVQFSVQGFKQIDEEGTLSFYDDPLISRGVLLDYQEKEIPAKKMLRLFFIVDGTKLPSGDVFAAIFARTKGDEGVLVSSVRVGTLLILTNGTPGVRRASIESISTPFLHLGNSVRGEIKIRNTASADTASGFFPKITINMWPFGPTKTIAGPLVYAGNSRVVSFDQPGSQLGIYKLTASYEDSSKAQWIFVVTGIWRWILLTILTAGFIIIFGWISAKKRRRNNVR